MSRERPLLSPRGSVRGGACRMAAGWMDAWVRGWMLGVNTLGKP